MRPPVNEKSLLCVNLLKKKLVHKSRLEVYYANPAMKPVALISMPTLSGRFPSFQLALLKPTLERAGIPAQPFSLFMYFGSHIGWRINEAIADVWPSMVGEWIWTRAAFGDEVDSDRAQYFQTYDPLFRATCKRAGCSID